jgi:hypothetical protein
MEYKKPFHRPPLPYLHYPILTVTGHRLLLLLFALFLANKSAILPWFPFIDTVILIRSFPEQAPTIHLIIVRAPCAIFVVFAFGVFTDDLPLKCNHPSSAIHNRKGRRMTDHQIIFGVIAANYLACLRFLRIENKPLVQQPCLTLGRKFA